MEDFRERREEKRFMGATLPSSPDRLSNSAVYDVCEVVCVCVWEVRNSAAAAELQMHAQEWHATVWWVHLKHMHLYGQHRAVRSRRVLCSWKCHPCALVFSSPLRLCCSAAGFAKWTVSARPCPPGHLQWKNPLLSRWKLQCTLSASGRRCCRIYFHTGD